MSVLMKPFQLFCQIITSRPNQICYPLKKKSKNKQKKMKAKTVQCLMISSVCDAFSVAGGCRQHHNSCGDCTQISISSTCLGTSQVFLVGLVIRLTTVLCSRTFREVGKSSLKIECLQVGQVWDFGFGFFFSPMQILLITVFMLWPIPSGALTS